MQEEKDRAVGYLQTGVWTTFRQRIPWLLVLMVSATFTGRIIAGFENALAAQSALILFIPMLMDTGGNSGSQASVTVIRSLYLHEIRGRDLWRVLWKEGRVALLCGGCLAGVNLVKITVVDNWLFQSGLPLSVSATVSLTLWGAVVMAKLVGGFLPILAKKCGLDPAVMAGPFITTVVDALSLLLYFGIARLIL